MERLTQLKRVIQSLEDQPEAQVPYLREAAQLGDYDSIRTLIHCYTYGDYGLDRIRRRPLPARCWEPGWEKAGASTTPRSAAVRDGDANRTSNRLPGG